VAAEIGNVRQKVRERVEEVRQRVRGQGTSGQLLQGVLPGKIGGGKLIETVQTRLNKITARAKERKPGVVPMVTEAIQKWQPGSRVKEVLGDTGALQLRKEDSTRTGRVFNLRE